MFRRVVTNKMLHMSKDGVPQDEKCRTLDTILDKSRQGISLSRSDVTWLLGLSDPDEIQSLFAAARAVRARHFDRQIFLYGFVYFSTHCRNNCDFCLYRKGNPEAPRYRKTQAEILESAGRLADSGVHLIDLTMGEDPAMYQTGDQGFNELLETIDLVRKRTGLPVMLSAGVLPETVLAQLPEAGVSWYACYQETHNRALYQQLRAGQDFDARMRSKQQAKAMGLLIEEGLLAGVGESGTDIFDSISMMRQLDADQVRVMSFVPQRGTPMAHSPGSSLHRELLVIAVLRLAFPDRLIPASLDVGGLAALGHKLAAGANVVTSLIPPDQGLAGVAQSDLDINEGNRTVAGIHCVLRENGLEAASAEQYRSCITRHAN